MVLSDICIRRPVFATVMSLMLVLVGIISYQRLSVREYPNIDAPVVTVQTNYPGASAEIMESQITQILEESLSGIEGIEFISSISRPESSQITINFKLDREPDGAASDVRDRVSRVRGKMPDEISEPVIQKVEADASPIIYLAFSSSHHSALEVSAFADRYVKDALQTLPGVAEVRIFGERRYSMRLWIDPDRLAAYSMTPQDIEAALRRQNVEIPSGRIESSQREFTVLSETDLRTPEQFNNLIIGEDKGYLVRFKDVGEAEIGPLETRRIARFNGSSAVAIGVVKQATANPLDVSVAVRDALPAITDNLPEGMRIAVAHDKSVFIEESIKNVYSTIAEAVGLVVLIIFFFLRSVRATLIPLVTIPVSLIGSFALMYAFGFSINNLTLLSLVLAIGLVVDDAIVMLENIYRHVEAGMSPVQAALKGSKEIGFAVVAMTITLAAVYAPVGFMSGTTGKLFTEFAWVLAGAVLVSGFVALTLSPMMCSRLLRAHSGHTNFVNRGIENGLKGLSNSYAALLRVALRFRAVPLLIGLLVAGSAYFVFINLKSELAPTEDQGTIVGVYLAPEGSTIDYTDRYAAQLEDLFKPIPEVDRFFVVTGFPVVSQGISFVKLKHWDERERKQQDIAKELQPKMFAVPGVMAFPMNPPPLGQSVRARPIEFVIMTSRSYPELESMVEEVLAKAREYPGLINVDTDLKLNQPQIIVQIDREKAANLGISVEVIGRTLETFFGGRQVTRFKRDGQQYDVIVQLRDVERNNPDDLSRVSVRAANGEMIQLSNLIGFKETVAPRALNHFNKLRSTTITANVGPGYAVGEALAKLDAIASEVLPVTAQVDYAGQSREFKQSSASLYVTFLLALAFIYLVLAAQFESFVDPFIIMLTVPLSMTGALAALYFAEGTLNIYSQVGLITLIGIITKHGILIVEFANQLQEQGKDRLEAVIESAVLRLRPILMTTGAMVLGALPLAVAFGAGAESRQQIGWVIIGGMVVGTFFTLFVIPAAYTVLASKVKH